MASKKRIKTDKYSTIIKPNLEVIEKMARDNFSEEDIAKHFKIAKSSFSRYKRDNLALRKALSKGKEKCIAEVENTYFKTALGFEVKEEKITYNKNREIVKIEISKKQSPPNPTVLRDILRNKGGWENKDGDSNNVTITIGKKEGVEDS